MSDENGSTEDLPITFNVKSSGNAKYSFTLPSSTTIIDLKNKLATAEYANLPPESQRLIYSGKVLKDTDTLGLHKVKDGNTMHLVKSAASNQRQNPASQGSASSTQTPAAAANPAAAGVPTNLATGTGNDPLAHLTGGRYAGYAQLPNAGMFGPDGGMGPPPGPEQLTEMLSNPQFAQMMNEALRNPQLLDIMIQQSPQLRAMGPQARQMLQSEGFRRMITDPEMLRSMARMQSMMGTNPFGGAGAQNSAFPAPGETNTTASENRDQTNSSTQAGQPNAQQQNPFASLGGQSGNPFAALFNPSFAPQSPPTSTNPSDNSNPTNNSQPASNPFGMLFNPALFPQQPPQQPQSQNPQGETNSPPPQMPGFNPFLNSVLNNPAMFQDLMRGVGGENTGAGGENPFQNLFGGLGGAGSPPAPADNRPPEERFSEQLRQLNDMGFYDFDRNVQALTRSGGNIQGAIEHLLGQP